MEPQSINTPTKNAMKYGAITGLALFVIFIIASIANIPPGRPQQFISYVVIIGGLYLGVKHYRDNELNGNISYGTALWSGTQIAFFCAIIISFGIFLYLKLVDDSMIEKVAQQTEQELLEKGLSDEDVERSMSMTRKFTTPGMMTFLGVISYTFMGFIFSLLIAAVLKRGSNSYDNFMQENQ